MLAPGYQARLFGQADDGDGPAPTTARWRVVDRRGRRAATTPLLVLAIGQARALALSDGRAWIVAADTDAVEITFADGAFVVAPCEPGWPATVQHVLAEHGLERSNP
jgi:hypothetical protein